MGLPGRPKGARNKRSLMVEILAEKYPDPFEILLKMAAGDWQGLGYDNETYVMENASGGTKIGYTITPEMRLTAAKECCQYLHTKRKQEPDDDEIEVMDIEQKKKFLEQAKKELRTLEEEIISEEVCDPKLRIQGTFL